MIKDDSEGRLQIDFVSVKQQQQIKIKHKQTNNYPRLQ